MSALKERVGGDMQHNISEVCDEIKNMLLEKNKSYGNSAGDPLRVFSRVDAIEQINVRIDDKLSRIARGSEYAGDDTELDLIGYLVLKRCLKRGGKDTSNQGILCESCAVQMCPVGGAVQCAEYVKKQVEPIRTRSNCVLYLNEGCKGNSEPCFAWGNAA